MAQVQARGGAKNINIRLDAHQPSLNVTLAATNTKLSAAIDYQCK